MIEYTNKITVLYFRLSVGDENRDGGGSNSIVNQKTFLERHARQHKLMNIRHYIDDDESGKFFDRSAYTQMISDVERGKIGIVIMKDINGMAERFNGRISDVLKTHRFDSGKDMCQTIERYVYLYNHQLPQSVLHSRTPMQELERWYNEKPELFQRQPRVPNRPGCNTYP